MTIQNGVYACVEKLIEDTGWLPLPLASGIESYSAGATPQYRRIDNKVYLKGAVKNVLSAGVIGTLPAGFRPVGAAHVYVQTTSMQTSTSANFVRMMVNVDGSVKIEGVSTGAEFGATKWFPINTEFLVD